MKLIIQIPCLNEEESLPKTLADLPKHIDGIDVIETLIIDDGSTDRTSEIAKENGVTHIVRLTKRKGLAKVFHTGLDACLKSGADIIVNTDADFQYNQKEIPKVVKPIIDGKADIVLTDRNVKSLKHMPFGKKYGNMTATLVTRFISGYPVKDAQSGFRAFSRKAAMKINVLSDYTYVAETIIQA
ncbi:MAG: glycosyltransferase family 2 protein, partial [Candidatus Heimdallarchaeota archaeon]|nr:glycosyltransferase family 2 protein [Candidatus Heimdallarchaeota archaeon]